MKAKKSLQKRSIFMIASILLITIGINTAILSAITYNKYKKAILSKTAAVGKGLEKDINKALLLGLSLEDIGGLEEKLKNVTSSEEDIDYTMVTNQTGDVLYHSRTNENRKKLNDLVTTRTLTSTVPLIQASENYFDLSFPLMNAEAQLMGVLRVGVTKDVIMEQLYELLRWVLGVALFSFLLTLGLVYFAISRFITRPILKMERIAERIAAGDLTQRIDIRGKDEIASLGTAINTMASSLKNMISDIREMTNNISSVTENMDTFFNTFFQKIVKGAETQRMEIEETAHAIEEINQSISSVAGNAQRLSESSESTSSSVLEMSSSIAEVSQTSNIFYDTAQESASAIEGMIASITQIADNLNSLSSSSEETASAISEINNTVKQIENNANESVKLAEDMNNAASERGMGVVNAAVQGMEEIKNSVESLSQVIHHLGQKSEEIGNIVTVIDEITEKTNLLALNAAILAAQAGEDGKAFAVVAEEIKGLSDMTSQSTSEISDLILSVQKDTKSSMDMAKKGIQSVDKGMKLITNVNRELISIVKCSENSTDMSKAIQKSTVEQVMVIDHVSKAIRNMTEKIDQISTATQTQSEGSQFIVEASDRIKNLAQKVRTATHEQSQGSKLISSSIDHVATNSEEIAKATQEQKNKSSKIVKSMNNIKEIAFDSADNTKGLTDKIKVLKVDAKELLSELQKFTV